MLLPCDCYVGPMWCYMVAMWLLCVFYVVAMWLLCGCYKVAMWLLCGYYLVVCGCYAVVMWLSLILLGLESINAHCLSAFVSHKIL